MGIPPLALASPQAVSSKEQHSRNANKRSYQVLSRLCGCRIMPTAGPCDVCERSHAALDWHHLSPAAQRPVDADSSMCNCSN